MHAALLHLREPEPGTAGGRPIRLLIVDDSAVARAMLARMVGANARFEIAATLAGAQAALAFLARERVDTILLDIEMPGLDGLTALPAILEASAGAHVLIVSSSAADGATATMRALTLGAADTLAKPGTGVSVARFADMLIERLQRIGHADPRLREEGAEPAAVPRFPFRALAAGPVECLAVGASTGGLKALSELLRALTPAFDAPILVTQHLPPEFMPFFAAQLREISGRPTEVAATGMPLPRGGILVAPGEGHLCLKRSGASVRVLVEPGRAASGCLPSVDPMLASAGAVFGAGALGVVLTGMGRDGLNAAPGFVEAGGSLIVQDRESSVVWGMPGVIAMAGLASAVARPRALAEIAMRRGSAR